MAVIRRGLGVGWVFLMGAATLAYSAPTQTAVSRDTPPAVEQWILHFQNSSEDMSARAFTDLLAAIDPRARVHVAVPAERDIAGFRASVEVSGEVWDMVSFFIAGPTSSPWARDRYVTFERRGVRCMLLPDRSSVPPDWSSDLDIAAEIALDRTLGLRRIPTSLLFEGGDLVMSRSLLLTSMGTIEGNARQLHIDAGAARRELEHVFGRRVVALGSLDGQPPHEHADMYVHLLDDHTALLGDPRLAAKAWEAMRAQTDERARLEWFGPCSVDEQEVAAPAYDRIALQLTAAGLKVERVPALHARYNEVLLTWTNVITEMRDGEAHVYVPSYGLPTLDRKAHETWRRLGYVVHPIDCAGPIVEGGGIRCLTNTVRRPSAGRSAPPVDQNAPAANALRLLEPTPR